MAIISLISLAGSATLLVAVGRRSLRRFSALRWSSAHLSIRMTMQRLRRRGAAGPRDVHGELHARRTAHRTGQSACPRLAAIPIDGLHESVEILEGLQEPAPDVAELPRQVLLERDPRPPVVVELLDPAEQV